MTVQTVHTLFLIEAGYSYCLYYQCECIGKSRTWKYSLEGTFPNWVVALPTTRVYLNMTSIILTIGTGGGSPAISMYSSAALLFLGLTFRVWTLPEWTNRDRDRRFCGLSSALRVRRVGLPLECSWTDPSSNGCVSKASSWAVMFLVMLVPLVLGLSELCSKVLPSFSGHTSESSSLVECLIEKKSV